MLICIQNQQKQKYITLEGIMPYNYGISALEVLRNRAYYLMSSDYDKKLFNRQVGQWIETNKDLILSSYLNKTTQDILINLPLQCISLKEAIERKYIQIKVINKDNPTILANCHTIEKINYNFLAQDISQELLLAISVSLTNTALELLRLKHDPFVILQCCFLIGVVKGVFKTASDILSEKKPPSSTILSNCMFEICAEIAAEILIFRAGLKVHISVVNTFKHFLKSSFEQIAGGYSLLLATTSLSLEMFKSSFKEATKTLCSSLAHQIFFEQAISTFLGTILSASFINIFINHCTL